MLKNKYSFASYGVFLLVLIGVIVELIGGALLSPPQSVGVNYNISPVLIIGMVLIGIALVLHIVVKVYSEKWGIAQVIVDVETYIIAVAVFFAVFYLLCVMFVPVIFPSNG